MDTMLTASSPHRRSLLVAIVTGIGIFLAFLVSTMPALSTTVPVTVSMDVASQSWISAVGCPSNTADITQIGVVVPGAQSRTGTDCHLTFGSNQPSSMLKAFQHDGYLNAMFEGNWTPQTPDAGYSSTFWGAWAHDDQHAWAVGSNNMVQTTNDGGLTWTQQAVPPGSNFYRISGLDSGHIWITGTGGTILYTTSGGTTWTPQTSNTAESLDGLQAITSSPGTVWAVGFRGAIVKTTNYGTTWVVQNSGVTKDIRGFGAYDASTAWAVGDSGTILHTTNGGATWTTQNAGTILNLRGVAVVDQNTVFASGYNGTILKTLDGGATWTQLTSGSTQNLRDIRVFDADNIWIAGWHGTVLSSNDGGATWFNQHVQTTRDLRGTIAISPSAAWAVGDGGTILKLTQENIPDYQAGVHDFAHPAGGFFGACLRAIGGNAAIGAGTWGMHASCPLSDGTWWNGFPLTDADPGAKVATDSVPGDTGSVDLRFGVAVSSTQVAGDYRAPVLFETIAPAA